MVIAKNNLPIVDLVIHKPTGKRKLGLLKGKIFIPDDFNEESQAINELFYGSDHQWYAYFLVGNIKSWKAWKKFREKTETPTNIIYVSSISITELMIKSSIGKLEVDFDPIMIAKQSGFELLDFSAEDALALKTLPFHHEDPFDRMLISQALNRKYALMTNDVKIAKYDCRLVKS